MYVIQVNLVNGGPLATKYPISGLAKKLDGATKQTAAVREYDILIQAMTIYMYYKSAY